MRAGAQPGIAKRGSIGGERRQRCEGNTIGRALDIESRLVAGIIDPGQSNGAY